MTRKPNLFSDIIAARQQDASGADDQAAPPPVPAPSTRGRRTSKRDNPDYSAVTVYLPTEIYARAQFEMTRKGRKREMSALFAELLEAWLAEQS